MFATALAAAGAPPPRDRVNDGKDRFPLLSGKEPALHPVVFGHLGSRLATVRDDRWKLQVLAPRDGLRTAPGQPWHDPRGPDGVTILAPSEQPQPTEYPGLRTGAGTRAMRVFDLENDPAEPQDVAADHGAIMARLKADWDQMVKDFPAGAAVPTRAAAKTAP